MLLADFLQRAIVEAVHAIEKRFGKQGTSNCRRDDGRRRSYHTVERLESRTLLTATPVIFQPQQSFATDSHPVAIATADVNSDGNADVIIAPQSGGGVDVLLGDGNGGLLARRTFPTPISSYPNAIAVSDVNGDGKPDLIVADASAGQNSVCVLLGNGDGAFQSFQTFGVGSTPTCIVVADMNGDGKPDLAVSNAVSNNISILIGNGNGTFQSQHTFATDSYPRSVAVADVNGDGKLDLATANNNQDETVSILLGDGHGDFQSQRTFFALNAFSITIADVNKDGKPDVAIAEDKSLLVGVLLGNGDGTFQQDRTFSAGATSKPDSIAVSDMNGDGNPDLIVCNFGSDTGGIFLGDGTGNFAPQQTFGLGAGSDPRAIAATDLNGDGKPDLVVANYSTNTVSVFLQPGGNPFSTNFKQAQLLSTGVNSKPNSVAVADFNGDGRPDLAATDSESNSVGILLGTESGTFLPENTFSTGAGPQPASVTAADLSYDGKTDLVIGTFGAAASGAVGVLLGNGDGTFKPVQTFSTGSGSKPIFVAVADVNGDGRADLIVVNRILDNVGVLLGNGNGAFQAQQTFSTGVTPLFVSVADVNGDGKPDLAVADSTDNTVSVLRGNGDGTFQSRQSFPTGAYPSSVVITDVNNDGKLDLAVANYRGDNLSVLLGNGDGSFKAQQTFAAGPSPRSIAFADVDGDGRPDLIAANFGPLGTVSVLLGNGDGAFHAPQTFVAGSYPESVRTADLNGDGMPDIAVADYSGGGVSVLLAAATNNGSVTNLAASVALIRIGGSVTFTATVAAATGGPTPTGSITFTNGGVTLGIVPLQSDGTATLTTAALATGTNSITANYSGDRIYGPSTSPPANEVVTNGPVASISAPDITNQSSVEVVTIEFTDPSSPIDATTLTGANLNILAPDGSSPGVIRGTPVVNDSGVGRDVTETYTLTLPVTSAGVTTGTYFITLLAGMVKDMAGNSVAPAMASFSVNSVENTGFGSVMIDFASEAIIPLNGGNLLIGHRGSTTDRTSQGVMELLDANGSPDHTFGANGIFSTQEGDNDAFFGGTIEKESNGDSNIIAVGSRDGSFLVARIIVASHGSPDTSFGNGGYATATFGSGANATASTAAPAPDGSIVVAGQANNLFAVAQFISAGPTAGSLDPKFNGGGKYDASFPKGGQRIVPMTTSGLIVQVVVSPEGKIIGVGHSGAGVIPFALTDAGDLDAEFNHSLTAIPSSLLAVNNIASGLPNSEGIALQPGGDVLVCGQAAGGGLGAVRLDSSGTVDTATFGNIDPNSGAITGVASSKFSDQTYPGNGSTDQAYSVVVDPSTGEFLLVGITSYTGAIQTAVAAFNPDGTLQPKFGADGQQTLPHPSATNPSSGNTHSFHPQNSSFATAAFDVDQADQFVLIIGGDDTSSDLRKLNAFGLRTEGTGTLPTVVKGHLTHTAKTVPPLDNGTTVFITVTGGTAQIHKLHNQISLELAGSALAVTITTRGGTGQVFLAEVSVAGSLRSFNAPTATLIGAMSISGSTGHVTLGDISGVFHADAGVVSLSARNVSGTIGSTGAMGRIAVRNVNGTIAAGQNISSFSATSLDNARILAGVSLGSDGLLGGTGDDADNYGPAKVNSITISGSIATSVIAVGVLPINGIFGDKDENDKYIDKAQGSGNGIHSITVRHGIDMSSVFETSTSGFPRFVNIPKRKMPGGIPNFVGLAT